MPFGDADAALERFPVLAVATLRAAVAYTDGNLFDGGDPLLARVGLSAVLAVHGAARSSTCSAGASRSPTWLGSSGGPSRRQPHIFNARVGVAVCDRRPTHGRRGRVWALPCPSPHGCMAASGAAPVWGRREARLVARRGVSWEVGSPRRRRPVSTAAAEPRRVDWLLFKQSPGRLVEAPRLE